MNERVVIITGAGSGIGQATAQLFDQNGWCCWLVGRDIQKLEKTAVSLHNPHRLYSVDLTALSEDDKLSQDLLSIDKATKHICLVNNAAQFGRSEFDESSSLHWKTYFWDNIQITTHISQYFLRKCKERKEGTVINVTSTLALRPVSGTSAYSAYKAALHSLTESWALEYANYNVRVNSVAPGIVDTPIHPFHDDTHDVQGLRQVLADLHPLSKLGQPMDVAHGILFLADSKNSWLTGESLKIDGGISLTSK